MKRAFTELRRYRSDDRDLDGHDHDLLVFQGENSDWYASIVPHGERLGPAVRVTTSGVPRGFEHMPMAMMTLYRALGGEAKCVACSIEAEIGTEEVPHPVPEHFHNCSSWFQRSGDGP